MFYFWGVILDLGKYIFPWQACFIWEVILDLGKYRIFLSYMLVFLMVHSVK
jgi:hypothetical protein